MKDKVLALDIDGVVLDHAAGFHAWAKSIGIETSCLPHVCDCYAFRPMFPKLSDVAINMLLVDFSVSAEFENLPVMPHFEDALAALREEFAHLKLIAITAPGTAVQTIASRKRNLASFEFDEVHVLDMGASKRKHLERLPPGTVYVDDLLTHVQTASELGLRSALFRQPHNSGETHHLTMDDWRAGQLLVSNLLRSAPVLEVG
jgi:FMN phosphatase YigB (HAD superfamily)